METNVASGLEGVVVAETELSDVDGIRGELIIRGVPVEELAERASFEEACALLWYGDRREPTVAELSARLGRARVAAFAHTERLGPRLRLADGMDALRASVSSLVATGDEAEDRYLLTGAVAVFATAWSRSRKGEEPVAPDPLASHASDVLRMVTGRAATAPEITGLNAYLCTVIDHGLNASTFAARVVASTGSDSVSAMVAAIGALKGPLHGGAPGPVLDMLDAIGSPEKAASWLAHEIDQGRRIMGMGHRIYRVRDPRAVALERAAQRLSRSQRLILARAVEREAEVLLAQKSPGRALKANVEFYTAVLLEAVGIPREMFSPTFAMSRVAGWCAHVAEQRARGRLIRPASHYIGPRPAMSA